MAFTYRGLQVLEPHDWRMRWARPPQPTTNPSPRGYYHHTAGNGRHTWHPADAFFRQNEDAIREGLRATDYSVLVHTSDTGVVTLGLARDGWLPAATRDQNTVSKAVCAMGYYHPGHALSEPMSEATAHGVAVGFDLLIARGRLVKDVLLLGHRDNPLWPNATACPGNYGYTWLPKIREWVAGWNTTPPPLPVPPILPDPIPTTPTNWSNDMIYVLRFGGSPDANWQGWVSTDWGFSRRVMTSWHHASVIIGAAMREGRVIDAKTGAKVANWGQVTHTNNVEELDEWLSPSRD